MGFQSLPSITSACLDKIVLNPAMSSATRNRDKVGLVMSVTTKSLSYCDGLSGQKSMPASIILDNSVISVFIDVLLCLMFV